MTGWRGWLVRLPLALGLAACTASPTATSPNNSPAPSKSAASAIAKPPPGPPKINGVTWVTQSTVRGEIAASVAILGNGSAALWLNPRVLKFRFIPGVQYPENSPLLPADTKPSTWVGQFVAAFNGGYKLSDRVGGYFYANTTVQRLQNGYASLVISKQGSMAVGVWGRDFSSTTGLVAVRQNLTPLVVDGRSMAKVTDGIRTWGIPARNQVYVNRSALGQLIDGSLVYVFLHNGRAYDLGRELVHLGVRTAINLDMNGGWPAAFTYSHSGGKVSGRRISSAVFHGPDIYYDRPLKDFVVALPR